MVMRMLLLEGNTLRVPRRLVVPLFRRLGHQVVLVDARRVLLGVLLDRQRRD